MFVACFAICCLFAQAENLPTSPPDSPGFALAPADRMGEVRSLEALADPLDDDWSTEMQYTFASKQLKTLAKSFETGTLDDATWADLAVPDARSTPLYPTLPREYSLRGELRIRRFVADFPPEIIPARAALGEWLSVFEQLPQHRRCAIKVVAVEARDESNWTITARIEATGANDQRIVQHTIHWDIDWIAGDNPQHPKLTRITLRSLDEVTSPAPLFADSTAAVLGSDTALIEQLGRGAEYWYGRIDAVGEPPYMGHNGMAVGDVNGDGLEDLYVALGTGLPNKLLVQQPDGTVRDTAFAAGVAWLDDTKGVIFADMDHDGDQDLLCAIGPSIVLCKNDGTGKFGPFISMNAPDGAAFYSLALADYDLDGDLDIYGCRYVKARYGLSLPVPMHDANNGPSNHLMRNDGDDRYSDVTFDVGLDAQNRRFSLAAAWVDYDDDGDPDLSVANDFGRKNLYRNDGGRFTEVAAAAGAEDLGAGMGVSWSDYDLDGDLDVLYSNMFSSAGRRIAFQDRFKESAPDAIRASVQRHSLGNTLLANQGDGTFRDVSDVAGIRMGRWSWGSLFADINHDGYDDMIVPNGFLTNEKSDDL